MNTFKTSLTQNLSQKNPIELTRRRMMTKTIWRTVMTKMTSETAMTQNSTTLSESKAY